MLLLDSALFNKDLEKIERNTNHRRINQCSYTLSAKHRTWCLVYKNDFNPGNDQLSWCIKTRRKFYAVEHRHIWVSGSERNKFENIDQLAMQSPEEIYKNFTILICNMLISFSPVQKLQLRCQTTRPMGWKLIAADSTESKLANNDFFLSLLRSGLSNSAFSNDRSLPSSHLPTFDGLN